MSPATRHLVAVLFVLGCGKPAPAPSPRASDPEVDALRPWALAAPGHDDAKVSLVERRDDPDAGFHVVARDGVTLLDAWVASSDEQAEQHWHVAELVAAVRRTRVDALHHAQRRTLVVVDGRTVLCDDDPPGRCFELPTALRIDAFWCHAYVAAPCTLRVESEEGRLDEWEIDGDRLRLARSWPSPAHSLEGPWEDVGARAEAGEWQPLGRAVERPAALDDPALAEPDEEARDRAEQERQTVCVPTVRSFRRGDLVVRSVDCGPPSHVWRNGWPPAFVVTHDDRTGATPLFVPPIAPPHPERPFTLGKLGGAALGFVAGSGTRGAGAEVRATRDLWVVVPTARGARLHRLELGTRVEVGLGADDHDRYVTHASIARARFEVLGTAVGHFVECERWSGRHDWPGSDRWTDEHTVDRVDLGVTFHPIHGFAMDDADRAGFLERCTAR